MIDKKAIKKEISVVHWFLLTTSKILIGMGIGIVIATHFWIAQPLWFILVILGGAILIPTLYHIERAEVKKEIELKKRLKKK